MALKKVLMFLSCVLLTASEWEPNVSSSLNISPVDFANHTHLLIDAQWIKPNLNTNIIISPKFRQFINKTFDASMGLGLRHSLHENIYGMHVFMDFSKNLYTHFPQIGACCEFFNLWGEFRLNFYHPFPYKKIDGNYQWRSHKWTEMDATFKFPKFHVSLIPGYDFTKKIPINRIKFTIPNDTFSFSSGLQYDMEQGFLPFIFFTVHFHNFQKSTFLKSVNHCFGVRCDGRKITPKPFLELKPFPAIDSEELEDFEEEEKMEEPKAEVEAEVEEEELIILGDEVKVQSKEGLTNDVPASPEEKSWWQSIFGE